ncbi:type II toxin-antitoxin system RelE/ParE family toxin [Methylocaldum sp. GT1BB]|jgi:proteic killer suppression protein|uniref:type II toxin-antitoxin system RelE/ParE family toxin n=1 Tax=Methylocaldum sp. GT1BB TaxID=3438963 RepID=UPI003D9FEF0D
MDVRFSDELYDRLETDARFVAGFPGAIVSMYRKRLQQIRSATDERDLYALKSLRLEKLKGNRSHQHSMRLNDQWRLIIEIQGKSSEKIIHIIGIEDYH